MCKLSSAKRRESEMDDFSKRRKKAKRQHDILTRVQSNPTLRHADYRAIIDALPYKQKEWAKWLCISEEHLSRILSGKKIASFTTEKLFRFHAVFELTKGMDAPDAIRVMRGTVGLMLTPMELVPPPHRRNEMSDVLKPCAHCGGTEIHGGNENEPWIVCKSCGASCPTILAWNTRECPWQPIETAPRDGTRILVGCFRDGSPKFGRQCVDRWHLGSKDHYTGWGWFNGQHSPATHWQPLNAAPSKGEGVRIKS